MMDEWKYYPRAFMSGMAVRTILYPMMLIKTRIQIQKHKSHYTGTFDAFRKILQAEKFRGLYKGYWVSTMLVVPQMAYITTYEKTRVFLKNHEIKSDLVRSLLSGGAASMVGQTFLVPIDIVTQHLMMITKPTEKPAGFVKKSGGTSLHQNTKSAKYGTYQPLNIPNEALNSGFGRFKAIVKAVYRQNGIRGFYKGYLASLSLYAPSSAAWWAIYDLYSGKSAHCIIFQPTRGCFAVPDQSIWSEATKDLTLHHI